MIQGGNIFRRPRQHRVLGPPEAEPHGVGDLRLAAERRGGLQQRGHAGAVVVDAGTVGNGVQMRARHHHVVGVAGLGLCHHVSRLHHGRLGVERQQDRRVGAAQRGVGVLVDDPDGHLQTLVVAGCEQPLRAARPLTADDEKPHRAACDGGVLLVDDRATGVVDDGDGACHPLGSVVCCHAARRLLRPQRDGAQAARRGWGQQRCLVDGVFAARHG